MRFACASFRYCLNCLGAFEFIRRSRNNRKLIFYGKVAIQTRGDKHFVSLNNLTHDPTGNNAPSFKQAKKRMRVIILGYVCKRSIVRTRI